MVSGKRGALVVLHRVSEAKQMEECPLVQGGASWHGVVESKKAKRDVHMRRLWPHMKSQRTRSQVRSLCVRATCM